MMQPDFVFDSNRCTGCGACRLACSIENGLRPEQSWRQIHTFNPQHHPAAPVFHLSLACNHCHDAACMNACPALAYHRDPTTQAVLVDPDKCMGCRYCTWACPYDAPQYDERQGIVTKCTFCVQRLHAGQAPACASFCPTGALSVTAHDPLARPTAQNLPGFPQTELFPSLQLIPLQPHIAEHAVPGVEPPSVLPIAAAPRLPRSRVNLRSEWSLLAFTFTAAVLVALMVAHALAALTLPAGPFVAAATLGLGLGAAHLGRKERAWRAILNLRRSWLSREIAAYSSFVAVSTASLLCFPASRPLAFTAAFIGLVTLYCVDQVYRPVLLPPAARPHSALVLLIGPFLGAVFARSIALAFGLGLLKLGLYARRKHQSLQNSNDNGGRNRAIFLTALRVLVGFALPALAWNDPSATATSLTIAGTLLGELIDRTEYYTELGFTTPQRGLALELARRIEHP